MHSETRLTKIVATVGPASWDPAVLEEMILAGVDVFRLNFSHGDAATHVRVVKDIREASDRLDKEVGILGDLPGPKLRVGEYPQGVVDLVHGTTVTITSEDVDGTATLIPVDWPELCDALKLEDTVYLADGSIRLRVTANDGKVVEAEVEVGGPLSSHKGMNLPGVEEGLASVSEDDLGWVEFAVANQLDYIAVSFVRSAADLDPVLDKLKELSSSIPIIAKIEKPQAADAVEEIVEKATGGIMVARGDLGIEVPLAKVPVLQKSLIRTAGKAGKTVITATQMLASMVSAKRPTRAEVTDVATAIYDGTDAIMLSEETAVGDYPVEAVKVMDQIARGTETDLPYWDWVLNRVRQDEMDVSDSVTQSAVIAAYRLNLQAIVVPTASGRTAKVVAAHRPRVPVLAVTHSVRTQRQLKLMFGVRPVVNDQTTEIRNLLYECADDAVTYGAAKSGDLIAIVAGLSDMQLGTNLFEVHRVP
ncbi:MAG: pyruvate kinase [Solirubrobacterales bacterium 67-14]|nr:MAG: pyruvate kinase [Solirubrobacterales bacterium 67-14]